MIASADEQVVIEGAAHFLQEDKPEEIVAAMRAELFS
jgi:pimeloyl-ACP methyl ester carboxylesterase